MSSGSSWETTTFKSDPLRGTLVERAKKRRVRAKTDRNYFAVSGSVQLGDAYDTYDVHLLDDGSLHCSCQNNRGGEYRKVCSHRTAVILWRDKHEDPWEDEPVWEIEDEIPDDQTISEFQVSGGNGVAVSLSPRTDHATDLDSIPPEEMLEGSLTPLSVTAHDPSDDLDPDEFDPYELDWDNPPSPQDISWNKSDFPLPEKFEEFRLDQWHGIIEVIEALDQDNIKAVFLSAPTGSGKSLVAASVPQILGKPFIYTCTTHVLQNQVETEFSYAKVLKGRRNYPTYDDPSLTADDCTRERAVLPACPDCPGYSAGGSWDNAKYDDERGENEGDHCRWCHPTKMCAYNIAKEEAIHARMAVLNTAYFLSETNYVFKSVFRNWGLVFMDEADMLEGELMDFITVEITPQTRKDLNIGLPAHKTVESSWVEWIDNEVIPAIKMKLADLPQRATDLFGKPDPKVQRARRKYDRLLQQVKMLTKPIPPARGEEVDPDAEAALMNGWVLTGWETKKGEEKQDHNVSVTFKPITVRDYARTYLWDQAEKFVLMSATIISPEQMAYDLGLEDHEWEVVEIPSSFPKERRPVVVRAETSVTRKTEQSAFPILIRQLGEIMDEHPDERILVHSNSYKLTRELFFEGRHHSQDAKSRLYTYLNAQERDKALNNYLNNPRGVLVAPSFERGVDLHGDDCRVIVIAKVPFPYLGDKQVAARLHGTGSAGKVWYAVETIRTIVQMTGRGMRSKDDWAISYVLDREFLRVHWDHQKLFPQWWREALVMDENDPKWRGVLEDLKGGML